MQHFDNFQDGKQIVQCKFKKVSLFFLSVMLTLSVSAATFIVNTTNDTHAVSPGAGTGLDASGNISFRSALEAANALGGAHTINVPAGTYNLSLGKITMNDIAQNITINGAGAAITIVHMTTTLQDRILLIGTTGVQPDMITSINNMQFSGGVLTSDPYGGGAIIAGGPRNSLTLNGCIFQNNAIGTAVNAGGAGGAVRYNGGGTLTIENCTFTNNTNPKADGGAVSYFLENLASAGNGSVSITNSTFTDNTVTAGGGSGGGAVHIAAQGRINAAVTFSVSILKNTFTGNAAIGAGGVGGAIEINNGFDVGNTAQVHYNRIVNNTSTIAPNGLVMVSAQGNVDANDNWWGCNSGPNVAGACDKAAIGGSGGTGTLTATTWLQLQTTASPATICNTSAGLGNTSAITTSFLKNSAGASVTLANLTTVIGGPVTWSSTIGSLSAQQTTIQANGQAMALFTSDGTGGTATVNAQVDNVPAAETSPARASITVNTLPTVTNPANTTACVGGTATFTSTITGTPAPAIQWRIGTTALADGLQASGSTISGANTATLTITNAQLDDVLANYNVQASNTCGIASSANAALTVNIPSVAPTGISGTANYCTPGSTTLTAVGGTLGTGANYQWGTGSVVGTSPLTGETSSTLIVSSASTTTYWVRIENTSPPCAQNTSGVTQLVTVNQSSVAPTGATGITTICSGASTTLTVAGGTKGTGATTEWFTGSCEGTPAGTGDAIIVSPTTTTTYYVRYNGTCNTTTCATVTVNITSNNTITLTSATGTNAQKLCINTPVTNITYSTTGATGADISNLPPGVTGSWLNDEVTISGTPSASGTFNYTVTLTGGCGSITANGSISVDAVPTVNAPSVTQPSCVTPTGTIIVNATGAGTLEYSINGGGNWQASNTFSMLAPGNYNIAVRLQNTTCFTSYSSNPVVLIAATGCTVPPVFTLCPATKTLNTDAGVCTATVSLATLLSYVTATGTPAPTLTVKVGTTTVTSSYAFPKGNTTVTITASNGALPNAVCSFIVTVTDNQPPVINTITNPFVMLWSPNHKYQKVNASQFVTSVTDNCSSIPVGNVVITKVTSDELDDAPGTGDGNTTQDIKIAANCKSVDLRSERMDGGNGRVYTIYLLVTDGGGNTATATARAIVAANQSGITAIDDGPVYAVNSSCNTLNALTKSKVPASSTVTAEKFVVVSTHPNPFSSFTTIRYQLPADAQVNLAVYNSLGQKIAYLVNGRMSAGEHAVRFDASGRAAGIYVYRLQTTDGNGNPVLLSGKMVIAK